LPSGNKKNASVITQGEQGGQKGAKRFLTETAKLIIARQIAPIRFGVQAYGA
jgi:hypothetical protein